MPGSAGSKYGIVEDGLPAKESPVKEELKDVREVLNKKLKREEVAKVLHEIIVKRMKGIFGRNASPDGYLVVIEEEIENLQLYMNYPFEGLPEGIKEKDLKDADKLIKLCSTT